MSDRHQPKKAAQKGGESLMPRVDAVDEAVSSPRRLAESGGTADHRPSETGHRGNPGLERGSPETQPRSCGSQPAHESLLNRRLKPCRPPWTSCELNMRKVKQSRAQALDSKHESRLNSAPSSPSVRRAARGSDPDRQPGSARFEPVSVTVRTGLCNCTRVRAGKRNDEGQRLAPECRRGDRGKGQETATTRHHCP